MSTSVLKNQAGKQGLLSFALSVAFLIFGLIYLACSHGMFSMAMHLCFVPFLISGIVWMVLSGFSILPKGDGWFCCLWYSAVITVTVGMILHGILFIYGTENALIPAYWIAGGILGFLAVVRLVYLIGKTSGAAKRQE